MTDVSPILAVAVAVGGSAGSAVGLGWWLSGQFRKVEKVQHAMLIAHEDKDQERHEENLERFGKISVALARMGYKNGE